MPIAVSLIPFKAESKELMRREHQHTNIVIRKKTTIILYIIPIGYRIPFFIINFVDKNKCCIKSEGKKMFLISLFNTLLRVG